VGEHRLLFFGERLHAVPIVWSTRVWSHAQLLLLGAILTPGARTVTAALRAMGLVTEPRFTNYHRVLNRATWSARQGSRILLSLLVALLVPPGVPHRAWGRRHRGTPLRAEDYGQRVVPGCSAILAHTCHPLFWPQMGRDAAAGPGALGPAGLGVTVSHRVVSASQDVPTVTAQDQY
jgi:hypothetical protein